jgi:beta-N-acetylhexosaminidase
MAQELELSRRAVLQAAALGAGGLLLEACLPTSLPASPGSTGTGRSALPSPSGTPAPSAQPIPLRERIARLLVVGFRGLRVDTNDWIAQAIAVDGIGGVILFDKDSSQPTRNLRSKRQVTNLVADLKALAPARELIIAIDQEGGVVTRLSPAYGFPAVPSEAAIGSHPEAEVRHGRKPWSKHSPASAST